MKAPEKGRLPPKNKATRPARRKSVRVRDFSEAESELRLTSLLDIVFILLIFIMVGASFTRPRKFVELDLPRALKTSAHRERAKVNITILENGAIRLNNQAANLKLLEVMALQGKFREEIAVIRSHRLAPFELFVKIVSVLRSGNCRKLRIEAQNKLP